MSIMLSPFPLRSFTVSSGNTFVADKYGILPNVETTADQNDLVKAGCAVINPPMGELLFQLKQADFYNSAGDQQFTPLFTGRFRIRRITAMNPSLPGMSIAEGGIYTGVNQTGTAIVPATQAYAGLTDNTRALDLTLNDANLVMPADTPLYLNLTVLSTAPATADLYVFGDLFP